MVGVVAEGVVSGGLIREGLVEPVSGEVPVVRGSEVEPIGRHALLGQEGPAAVRRTGAGGRVFVLLAVEAALLQGAHVGLGEVALGVAAPWQQLLALCRGGGEAIRVGRSVEPEQEGERRECEKRERKEEGVISCPNLKLSIKHLTAPHTLSLQQHYNIKMCTEDI